MAGYWLWWIAAAVLVGAELVTGTFYLLAVGTAAVAGGLAAWLGLSLQWQFVIAGAIGVALTMLAHHWRARNTAATTPSAIDSLDIGHAVQVRSWNPDGTARVAHRGAEWNAELVSLGMPRADTLYIVGTRGSTLLLSDRPPVR